MKIKFVDSAVYTILSTKLSFSVIHYGCSSVTFSPYILKHNFAAPLKLFKNKTNICFALNQRDLSMQFQFLTFGKSSFHLLNTIENHGQWKSINEITKCLDVVVE